MKRYLTDVRENKTEKGRATVNRKGRGGIKLEENKDGRRNYKT